MQSCTLTHIAAQQLVNIDINHHHHHHHLNRKGRWGTTDDFTTSFFPFFPVLHRRLGFGKLQVCPFLDAVFPPQPLPTLSPSPFHCALPDGFGQTW